MVRWSETTYAASEGDVTLKVRELDARWIALIVAVVLMGLWTTPVVLPLKILVVFFHEIAHGLAAVFTGGRIVEITFSPNQGGYAVTQGGWFFLVVSAGYLGSLAIGLALVYLGLTPGLTRFATLGLGVILLAITALYVRDLFPLISGLVAGGLLIGAARLNRPYLHAVLLLTMGLASIIYVPYDILSDTILRSGQRSDARILAERYGGPVMFWGGLWLVLAASAIWYALRDVLRRR